MTDPAQSTQSNPAAGAAGGWYDAAVSANVAWLSAWTGMAAAAAAAAETQAEVAGVWLKLWLQDAAPTAFTQGAALAEEGLLMAELEGERLADAARISLGRLAGGGTFPPLPE